MRGSALFVLRCGLEVAALNSKKAATQDGPLCEGAPAKRVGERVFRGDEASDKGKALSLRRFAPPPSQREAFGAWLLEIREKTI